MRLDGEKANSIFDAINTGRGNRGQSKDAKSNPTGAL
jgi:hypothetical protein